MEGSMFDVFIYSSLWFTFYFTLCLVNPSRSYEWHCRSVTVIHATVVTLLSAYCGFVQGPWPFTEAGGPNTPLQLTTVSICLGYFLFDLTWCLYYQTEGPAMLLHHTLSILGLTVCVISGYYGTEMIATIFGSEATNPLLQTRWFLRETGRYKSLLGEIVDHAFMLSFGFLRIGIGTYLIYCYFLQPTNFWGRLGGLTMYGISWLFWVNIVMYAIGKYKKKFKKYQQKGKGHDDMKCNGLSSPVINDGDKIANQYSNNNDSCHGDIGAKLHQNGVIKADYVITKDLHHRAVSNGCVHGVNDIQLSPAL